MTDKTKIIGVCYMVFGALGLLGLPMIYVHQLVMEAMISSLGQTDPAAMEVMQLIQDLMEIIVPLLVVLVVRSSEGRPARRTSLRRTGD